MPSQGFRPTGSYWDMSRFAAGQLRSILFAAALMVVSGWAPSPPHFGIPGNPLEIFWSE